MGTGENLNYAVLMERCITDPDTGLLFMAVEMGAVTPKVEPFEPTKSKKIRSNSVDPEGSPKKKKKKDKDKKEKKRSQSEPRPESPKMEILEAKSPKKDKKKKKDKDQDKEKEVSSKGSRSDKSDNLVSPKSQKSF